MKLKKKKRINFILELIKVDNTQNPLYSFIYLFLCVCVCVCVCESYPSARDTVIIFLTLTTRQVKISLEFE